MGVKVGGRFTQSRASEVWVSRAVQAAIEATTQIARLSSATGTHAFGPSPWTAAATTRAKPQIANPVCVPIARGTEHLRLSASVSGALRGTEGSNPSPSTGEMVWGRRRGDGTI